MRDRVVVYFDDSPFFIIIDFENSPSFVPNLPICTFLSSVFRRPWIPDRHGLALLYSKYYIEHVSWQNLIVGKRHTKKDSSPFNVIILERSISLPG